MRFSIEEGSYRVFARDKDDDGSTTLQMTPDGDRAFDRDQQALVEGVLKSRGHQRSPRIGFKVRGHDIPLHDSSVSRTHALVFVDAVSASVVDLMSTNGTKLNGSPARDVELSFGDVIQVGKTKMKVEEG
jgi:pSer/pThr/pTyr-binding forkhead associated (FHA) protein